MRTAPKKKVKIGRYIVVVLLIVILIGVWGSPKITMHGDYVIEKGDTYQTLLSELGFIQRMKLKYWMKNNSDQIPTLIPGPVTFTGTYTPQERFDHIKQSTDDKQRQDTTIRLTILEGWSSYDIDAKLVELGLITKGQYVSVVQTEASVNEYGQQFSWLHQQFSERLPSLEGYLYPDTYFLDNRRPIVSQLITAQLKAYQDKVRSIYGDQMKSFSQKLRGNGFTFDLTPYSIMRLASVIENEEKADSNKPMIAGIFLNRIQNGMRLDADVTLCYGKGVTYAECTPAFIVQHLYDKSNPYNTRQVGGLPPTPISNPAVVTIKALLEYAKSNNFYYLHDSKGKIYPAATVEEHNTNKVKYLN